MFKMCTGLKVSGKNKSFLLILQSGTVLRIKLRAALAAVRTESATADELMRHDEIVQNNPQRIRQSYFEILVGLPSG